MKNANIIASNGAEINHTFFKDLVSNLSLFNQYYTNDVLNHIEDIDKLHDNSDYSNFPTFEEVVNSFDPETDYNRTFVCRVSEDQLWSSDSSKGGFDRTTEAHREHSKKQIIENLKEKIINPETGYEEYKGFNDEDAGILNARVRYVYDYDTKQYYLTLVKNMGNHRFIMKKIVNRNGQTEYLTKIKFHDLNANLEEKDFIKIESESHHTDADNRRNQNESQKFYSGYKSGKKKYVELGNWLKKNKIEYAGFLELEGMSNDFELSSIQNLNQGTSYGLFSEYGSDNVQWAVETIKEVKKITKEHLINNTVLRCFAFGFKALTEDYSVTFGSDLKEACSKEQLFDFFVGYTKYKNGNSDFLSTPTWMMNDSLRQTKAIKSIPYIFAMTFWQHGIFKSWHRKINERQNGISVDHPCLKYIISKTDEMLQQPVSSALK